MVLIVAMFDVVGEGHSRPKAFSNVICRGWLEFVFEALNATKD